MNAIYGILKTSLVQFQGIAAIMDIVKPLTAGPQEAWTQQVARWRMFRMYPVVVVP